MGENIIGQAEFDPAAVAAVAAAAAAAAIPAVPPNPLDEFDPAVKLVSAPINRMRIAADDAEKLRRWRIKVFCDALNGSSISQIAHTLAADSSTMALSYINRSGTMVGIKNFIARGCCSIRSLQLLAGAAALPPDDRVEVLYDMMLHTNDMNIDTRARCIIIIRLLLGIDDHIRAPRDEDDLEGVDPVDPTIVLIPNECAIPRDVLRNYRRDGNNLFSAAFRSRCIAGSNDAIHRLIEVCDVNQPIQSNEGLPMAAAFHLIATGNARVIMRMLDCIDWRIVNPNCNGCNLLQFALYTLATSDNTDARHSMLLVLRPLVQCAPMLLEREAVDALGRNAHDFIAIYGLDEYSTCTSFYRADFVHRDALASIA
jgi:hypothetical protein